MAFQPFAATQYITQIETDTIIKMGSIDLIDSIELKYIRVLLYIKGTLAGNEKLTLQLYSDSAYTKKLYDSEILNVADIGVNGNWLGYVRFDFNRINLNKNLVYYLACMPSDYTHDNNNYLSLSHDYPFPRYTTATTYKNTNLLFEVFGYA